jgi:hypothetical protein
MDLPSTQSGPLPDESRRKPKPKPKRKESKRQHNRRKKRERQQRLAARRELRQRLIADDPDAVLLFSEWCTLNGFSPKFGRQLLADGDGPVLTYITAKRIGVARRHNFTWQEKRTSRPRSDGK